jgi:hypothetical protein
MHADWSALSNFGNSGSLPPLNVLPSARRLIKRGGGPSSSGVSAARPPMHGWLALYLAVIFGGAAIAFGRRDIFRSQPRSVTLYG